MGDFTSDWFSGAIPGVTETLKEINPKRFLEIGSWEGRSASWFLDTYPDSSIVCVDTFEGSPEHQGLDVAATKDRFLKNMARFGDRVTLRQGTSARMLFGLEPESFDCVYVDGSHAEDDTLADLVMGFMLLAPGGALLVDDYAQTAFPGIRRAVDKFAATFSGRLRSVLCQYQVHFIKLA
jgi:predicted O-methyltransferase YrrM